MTILDECHKKLTDLQKQVTQTSKNVLSRTQKWRRLSTVPSTDCDVVVIFKSELSEELVDWLIKIIRKRVPQLVVHKQFHRTSRQYALYLTASYRGLLTGAEELRIKKPLLPEHGGDLREFSVDELSLFDNVMNENIFLSTSERANIIHHFLMSLRACREDSDICSIRFADDQCMIPSLQSAGIILQIFPLHEQDELDKLTNIWIRRWIVLQPLDEIKEYFGIKVALYFAWLGHYTYSLIFPAIVGLVVWLFVNPNKNSSFYYLLMAIVNLIWTSLYLEHWKRTSSFLAYRWSSWDKPISLLEEPRPLFKGTLSLCPVTGRPVRTYPKRKRLLILCFVTTPVVLLSLIIVIYITLMYVRLQEKMNVLADSNTTIIPNFVLVTLPKIFLALSISLMDLSYRKIAIWLTDFENHRLEDDYNNHYVFKLILLQFVNSFYSLFYTAFYLKDLELLRKQLVTLLLIRQIIDSIREIFLPLGQSRLRQVWLSLRYEQKRLAEGSKLKSESYNSSSPIRTNSAINLSSIQSEIDNNQNYDDSGSKEVDVNSEMHIHQRVIQTVTNDDKLGSNSKSSDNPEEIHITPAEREATLLRYEDPTDDFLEMFIQFGYVSMFGGIFPLASLLAFMNNIIEIRGDAYKLSTSYQRPFAKFANSIGVWQLALDAVSYVAVIVNIALLGISGTAQRLFPNLSTSQLIICLVFIEHAIIVMRAAISALVPHTPSSVVHQIAKLEHRRREALKILERESMREHHRQQSPPNMQESDN
ncbi:Anoctamin-8 [Schistosoma japonicum]|nr:Anoctamin-8 [Schistosoma japonicum]KAH8878015.1 Anoctamin-8 [Schistosoma japonicum]KAH8878016.1 Anoctamin-8 [Schistosoma japonicum]KAH8878019.1 Anoctamin-8 [Schistosoma japonicum]